MWWRFIQDCPAEAGTEAQEDLGGQVIQERGELIGLLKAPRPRHAEEGSQPGKCGVDEATAGQIAPAAQGALTDHLIAIAAVEHPLTRRLEAVTDNVDHRLDNRADGEVPPP
jgi:hypothetical protein